MAYTYTDEKLRYKIHDTEATDAKKDQKIYLELPDSSSIDISNTASTITVTFPAGTRMRLESYDRDGTASPGYFDYHFMAFMLVTFYKADGTVISTIGSTKSSESCSGKTFDKYTVDYKIIERPGVWDGSGGTPVAGATDWIITNKSEVKFSNIPIPEDATMFTIAVRGESNLTRTGIYIGVEPCPCKEQYGLDHSSVDVFTDINAGDVDTISILDTGKISVTGTKASAGTNNNVKSCILTITCKGTNAEGETFVTSTEITLISSASAGGGNFTNSSVTLPDGTTTVSATLFSQGVLGIEMASFGDSITVTIDPPNPPTSIAYSTAKMNRPRLKDNLTWSWRGASRGTKSSGSSYNATIDGYRVMIYKNYKNGGATGSVQLKNVSGWALGHTSKDNGSIPYVEKSSTALSGSLTFNPIENVNAQNTADSANPVAWNTFVANDRCYCRVYSYAKWGPNKIYSKKSLLGIVDSSGTNTNINYVVVDPDNNPSNKQTKCILHNAATVWVRVDTDGDNVPDTWKEGTVYVYHDSEWKEAEGVYVRNGGKWKEST